MSFFLPPPQLAESPLQSPSPCPPGQPCGRTATRHTGDPQPLPAAPNLTYSHGGDSGSKAGTLYSGILIAFTHPLSLNKKVILSLSGLRAPEAIPDLEDSFQ